VEGMVEEAFKINKDKMMLAKIESWEQKKNITLNKSKLKERKSERMYIDIEKREIEGENRIQQDTDKRGMVYMG
jgi:hypothetical protein